MTAAAAAATKAGLNPQAPEFIPISFYHHPLYYQNPQTQPIYYFSIPWDPQAQPFNLPPQSPTAEPPSDQPDQQELGTQSFYNTTPPEHPHFQLTISPPSPTAAPPPIRRFGVACRRNYGFRRFDERKQNGFYRVVENCVMEMRRPKPVVPLKYGEGNVTTVMIRNIPNKLNRLGLMNLLDKHCVLVNQASTESGDHQTVSAYDFIYLPMDFKYGVNKGYAFVNFTNSKAVWEFYKVFHDKKWDDFISPKIAEIVCAKIQGKKELMKHFGSSIFMCDSDEYLPLSLTPPRDGTSGQAVKLLNVGKRNSRSY